MINSNSTQPVVLKLLSGLQRGAEAKLHLGASYTLGSSDNCDFVLHEESIADYHLTVTLQQTHIHLVAQQQAIAIGTEWLHPNQGIELNTATILQCGEVLIGIGFADSDWAALPRPQPPPAPNEDAALLKKSDDAAQQTQPAVEDEESYAGIATEVAITTDPNFKHHKWALPVAMLSGAILLALGAWLWLVAAPAEENSLHPPPMSATEATQKLLTELKIEGESLQLYEQSNGTVNIKGYCENQALKQRLTSALSAQGIQVDNRLWPEDIIQEAIKQTVERIGGKSVIYTYLGQGVLHLKGVADNAAQLQKLVATLHNDAPGLKQIDSSVKTMDALLVELQQQLELIHLQTLIDLNIEGSDLIASAKLNTQQAAQWNTIAAAFNNEYNGILSLEERIKIIANTADSSPEIATKAQELDKDTQPEIKDAQLVIRGVMMSPNQVSYVLLGNGRRIAEGEWIDQHRRIEAIDINQVIVRTGQQRHTYSIGGISSASTK